MIGIVTISGVACGVAVFVVTITNPLEKVEFFLPQNSREQTPHINVVLITIDTLCADHLSCYGYERINTKNIDKKHRHSLIREKQSHSR